MAKISDLGCSTRIDRKDKLTVGVGSPLWMAPEVVISSNYSFPSDIYSFGVVAYEVQNEKLPVFDKESRCAIIPEESIGYQLISLCTHRDPESRPPADELITIYTQGSIHIVTHISYRQIYPFGRKKSD